MDHMDNHFKQIVGIGCFSILLQFSAAAQNATSSPSSTSVSSLQEKVLRSDASSSESSSGSSSVNSGSNKIALISDATTKARSEAKVESNTEPAIKSPKVNPQNPALNFKVTARESKTDARIFAAPDSLGESQSFQATAYALKGRTRTGASVRRGVIAADPRVLPLGSVVQLRAGKYSGVYTVHDTGGRIKGNIIDVWVPDRGEARQFGRRKIQLNVLKMGPQRRTKK